MLALISPAKTLDYERPLPAWADATEPHFAADARRIARAAKALDADDLKRLMGISDALAALNVARFQGFSRAEARPALYAFAGDVYTGLDAHTLDQPAVAFAQGHLRILSGLYGLLRPLDAIKPYRLEMGTRWAPDAATLYAHWGPRLSRRLAKDLAADGSGIVINLASKEYWHAIEQAPPKAADVYAIDFMDEGPTGPRFNSFAAKRARGLMARYICAYRLTDVTDLKGFDDAGYAFDAAGSEARRWRFVRRR